MADANGLNPDRRESTCGFDSHPSHHISALSDADLHALHSAVARERRLRERTPRNPKRLKPCKWGCGAMLGTNEARYEHPKLCQKRNVSTTPLAQPPA